MINYTEQEEQAKRYAKNYTSSAVTIGIILVIVGVIVVLTNVGLFPYALRRFFISWQMLLIAFGIIGLVKGNKTAGALFIIVGTFFLLPKISMLWPSVAIFGTNFTHNFWPLLIILCGLCLIFTSRTGSNFISNGAKSNRINTADSKDGYLNYNFTFSGTEQVFLGPVFKGGNIKTTFGGASIDFRKTSLPENEPAVINVETTFGGVTLIVPENWAVEIRQNSFFGGFTDSRYSHPVYSNQNQRLIINAKCTFGGGEIK